MTSLFFVREVKGGDGKSFFWGGLGCVGGGSSKGGKTSKRLICLLNKKQRGKVGREGKWQYSTSRSAQTCQVKRLLLLLLYFGENTKRGKTFLPFKVEKSFQIGLARANRGCLHLFKIRPFFTQIFHPLSVKGFLNPLFAPTLRHRWFFVLSLLFSRESARVRGEKWAIKFLQPSSSSSPSSSSHHHAFVR